MDKRVPCVLGGTLMVLALIALISGSQEQHATVRETVVKESMVLAMARQMKLDAVDVHPQNRDVLQQLEAQPKQPITKSESQMADDLAFEAVEAVQKRYPGHNFLFKDDKKVPHKEKKAHRPHFHEPKWLTENDSGSTEKIRKPREEKAPTVSRTVRMAARVSKEALAPLPKKQIKQTEDKTKKGTAASASATSADSLRALQDDTRLAKAQVKEEKEETKALRAKMSYTRQKIYLTEAKGAVPVNGEEEVFMQQATSSQVHHGKSMSKSIETVIKRVKRIKAHHKFVKRELRHAKTTAKQAAPHKHGKLAFKLSKSVGKTIRKGNKHLFGKKEPMPVMPPIDFQKIGLEEAKRELKREAETVHSIASNAMQIKPTAPTKKRPKQVVTAAILSTEIARQADRAAAHALRQAESKARDTLLRDLDIGHHAALLLAGPVSQPAAVAPTPGKANAANKTTLDNVVAKVAQDSKEVAKAAADTQKKQKSAQKAAIVAKVASVDAKKAEAAAKKSLPVKPKGSMHIATVAKMAAKIAKVAEANKASVTKQNKAKKVSKAKKQAETGAEKAAAAKKKVEHQKTVKKVDAHSAAASKVAKVAAKVAHMAASNGRRRGVMKWNGHSYVKPVPGKVRAKKIMEKEKVGARVANVAMKVAKDAHNVAVQKSIAAQVAAKAAITTAAATKAMAAKFTAKMVTLVHPAIPGNVVSTHATAMLNTEHATTMLNTEAKEVAPAKKLEAIKREVTRLAREMPRPADAEQVVMKAAARILRKQGVHVAKRTAHRTVATPPVKAAVDMPPVKATVDMQTKVTVARPPASMDCHACRAHLLASCGRLSSLLMCQKDPRYSQLFSTIRDSCRTYLGLVQLADGSLSCPTPSTHKKKALEQAAVPRKSVQGAHKVSRAAVKIAPHVTSKATGHALVSSSESDLQKAVGLMRVSKHEEANATTRAHLNQREETLADKVSGLSEDAAEKAFAESFGSPSGEWATAAAEVPAVPLP